MKVFLDGTTGYLGSAIAIELIAGGHEVLGHVRTPEAALRVAARGVTPQLGNLLDPGWLRGVLEHVDGAIHAASPNPAGSAEFDHAILDIVLDAFRELRSGTCTRAAAGSTAQAGTSTSRAHPRRR